MSTFGQRLAARLRPLVRVVEPVAKVVETATTVLGALEKPTVFGVANAVASGARAIVEEFQGEDPNRWMYETCVAYGDWLRVFELAGVEHYEILESNEKRTRAYVGDDVIEVAHDGALWFASDPKLGVFEHCRKLVDRALPDVIHVVPGDNDVGVAVPHSLTALRPPQAAEIWERTRTMLDGGRVILLNGRPGVGKTTIAQAVARDARLGRVAVLDPAVISGGALSDRRYLQALQDRHLALLSIGVIVVDDVDKFNLDLVTLERLRRHARLVVLTANNGQYDRVLDAALMRPARIDEVFTIEVTEPIRRAPFDRLPDDIWAEVAQWPQAYLNEVEKRVVAGQDLRMEDLRDRLKLRTRSGEDLL